MFNYGVNIAMQTNGRAMHFGRVILPDTNEVDAKLSFEILCGNLPASRGFSLTLSRVPVKTSETIAYSEGA